MRSGRFVYSQTDLAIGPDEDGLKLTRTLVQPVVGHNDPFGNFSHNWDILLTEKRVNIQGGDFKHQSGVDFQMEVSMGGLQDTFRSVYTGAIYDHTSRTGFASLTFNGTKASGAVYTYRNADGVEVVFRPIDSNDCSAVLRCAYASEMTEADGTRYTFQYGNAGSNATRLLSVTSNRGYALVFEYSGGTLAKACVVNLATTTLPTSCPLSGVLTANYSYTYDVNGAPRLASATDAAGAAWTFTYAGSAMGFVRPNETTPWMTNTIWSRMNDDGLVEDIILQQNFSDGSSYSYGWGESPFVDGHISQIAGGSFTNALGETTSLAYDFPIAPRSTQTACTHNGCPWFWYEDTPQYANTYQLTPGPLCWSPIRLGARLPTIIATQTRGITFRRMSPIAAS